MDTPRKTADSCEMCGFVDQSPGPRRWTPTNGQYAVKLGYPAYTGNYPVSPGEYRFSAIHVFRGLNQDSLCVPFSERFSSNAYDDTHQKVAYLSSPLIEVRNNSYCLATWYRHSENMQLKGMLLEENYTIDIAKGLVPRRCVLYKDPYA